MDRFLKNPDPKYYMDRGDTCYLAVDSLHGGATFAGCVEGKCEVDGKDGYVFGYLSHEQPGESLTERVPAENLFPSMYAVDAARMLDRSVQADSIRKACSTVKGLVAFLLSRTDLDHNESPVVIGQIYKLGLAEADDETAEEN